MTDQTSWSALRKSIVIFGAARQGMSIVKWLGPHADDLLMVTQKPLELEEISKLGLDVAEVDFHSDESLHDVGIGRWVKTIFCALADDSENVFLTLSARALDPHLGILCIAQSQEAGRKMLAAGATTVIDSHEIAAKRINELIHHPTVVEALEHTVLGHSDLMLAEIEIDPDCKLVGHQLSELRLDDYNLVLFGVVDLETGKRVIFHASATAKTLYPGDNLVIIGPADEIQRLREDMNTNSLLN